jgi:hypothetical protein
MSFNPKPAYCGLSRSPWAENFKRARHASIPTRGQARDCIFELHDILPLRMQATPTGVCWILAWSAWQQRGDAWSVHRPCMIVWLCDCVIGPSISCAMEGTSFSPLYTGIWFRQRSFEFSLHTHFFLLVTMDSSSELEDELPKASWTTPWSGSHAPEAPQPTRSGTSKRTRSQMAAVSLATQGGYIALSLIVVKSFQGEKKSLFDHNDFKLDVSVYKLFFRWLANNSCWTVSHVSVHASWTVWRTMETSAEHSGEPRRYQLNLQLLATAKWQ